MADIDLNQFAVGGAARPGAISGLNPQFAGSIAQLFAAAPPEVQQQLRLTSAYRSPQRQAEILQGSLAKRVGPSAVDQWNTYVQNAGGDVVAAGQAARPWLKSLGITKWVAPPGSSNHQKGEAVDLQYLNPAATQWAHANAPKYGLNFPLSNEDWHIEPANLRSGGTAVASTDTAPTVANMQNKTLDPVGDVMTAAGQGAPQGGVAAMYAPPTTTPGGTSSAYDPQGVLPVAGADPTFGALALMFGQQQAAKQKQRENEQQAEQIRRTALLTPQPGVSRMFA